MQMHVRACVHLHLRVRLRAHGCYVRAPKVLVGWRRPPVAADAGPHFCADGRHCAITVSDGCACPAPYLFCLHRWLLLRLEAAPGPAPALHCPDDHCKRGWPWADCWPAVVPGLRVVALLLLDSAADTGITNDLLAMQQCMCVVGVGGAGMLKS